MLLFIFGSMLICLVYITLLRWLALPCIWIGIIALIGLLSYLAYLCYVEYKQADSWSNFWLGSTIVFGILAGLIAFLAICMCSRISLACQLIAEAGM